MLLRRLFLAAGLIAFLASTAFLAREAESTGQKMADSASRLIASLDATQKKKAVHSFDSEERFRYFFTPQQTKDRKPNRKGLALADMTDAQRKIAMTLLRTGTSESSYKSATTIISLESILRDLEKGKGPGRNPEWYFFTVFGTPSKTGRWGWRVEGHHLSLNFTIDGGKIVSATPSVYCANPAVVQAGASRGLRALPDTIDRFKDLVKLLSDEQKKTAKQPKLFPEIEENKKKPGVGKPVGITGAKLTAAQKTALQKLIDVYAERMPPEVAAAELAEVKKNGLDTVHFAYGGSEAETGKPYSYRVQGPTFVIEFLNEQADSARNPANHIHSAWRNIKGDFGLAE